MVPARAIVCYPGIVGDYQDVGLQAKNGQFRCGCGMDAHCTEVCVTKEVSKTLTSRRLDKRYFEITASNTAHRTLP